jgi:hypothetical protein
LAAEQRKKTLAAAMLVLYHCTNARSFARFWTLEEMQLDHKLVMLPFPPRILARDHLAINPLGTAPALRRRHAHDGIVCDMPAPCEEARPAVSLPPISRLDTP